MQLHCHRHLVLLEGQHSITRSLQVRKQHKRRRLQGGRAGQQVLLLVDLTGSQNTCVSLAQSAWWQSGGRDPVSHKQCLSLALHADMTVLTESW